MANRNIAEIISIYWNDRIDFVKLAVESILNQTYKDFDYYIQYDGPVDAEVDAYLSGTKDGKHPIKDVYLGC